MMTVLWNTFARVFRRQYGQWTHLDCAEEPRDGSATAFVSLLEGFEIYEPLDCYFGVMEDHRLPPWAKERADQLRKKICLEKPV